MDAWHKKRLRELEAAAPVKRKKVPPFAKVPLWWIEQATRATRTPKALLCVWLQHLRWKNGTTFSLPSGKLGKLGVNRFAKSRALKELEAAGLITVEWRTGKNPMVTMVV
jgi:hypothetical protein